MPPKFSFDPKRPDFAPYGLTCVRWAPTLMRRPDRHNEIELNFLRRGWLVYLLGGRKVRVEAGRLSAFWAAIPHQIIAYSGKMEYSVATIPLAWFIHCKLPRQLVQPLLHGRLVCEPETGRMRSDSLLFAGWEKDLAAPDPSTTKAVLLEMEGRLLRLALACPPWRPQRSLGRKRSAALSDAGLSKVEQMAGLIAQHYTEKMTVEMIARAVRLHPNYAMSLFRKAFGTTLIDYVTQHRVSHAQRLLATSDLKIVEIAGVSGFGSISRFNDAFLRSCGCSPRDYRQGQLPSVPREQGVWPVATGASSMAARV